jgi:hypothetical protein
MITRYLRSRIVDVLTMSKEEDEKTIIHTQISVQYSVY